MRRILTTAALALAFLGTAFAQQNPSTMTDEEILRDYRIIHINTERGRTEYSVFNTPEEALTKSFEQSPYYISLNGEWDFKFFEDGRNMPSDIASDDFKGTWDKITVPGNWERQGWGIPIYTNHPYEFCPENPQPPILPEVIPSGVYHRNFTIPSDWADRNIYLNICGAKSGVFVYLNGKRIGYFEDSKDTKQFFINDFLREGENNLTLKIWRWSTGSFFEDQDFWRISGIERDVFLSSTSPASDVDFKIIADLDTETYSQGQFKLKITPKGLPNKQIEKAYGFTLYDAQGQIVASEGVGASEEAKATQRAGASQKAKASKRPKVKKVFEAQIPQVKPWSAETPDLYTLVIECKQGEKTEYIPYKVGFRHFEIRGDQYLINGQPVIHKGVNLHEHNEFDGHHVTEDIIRKDIELMKQNNINAVRTSHYPQPRRFYELANEYGIYVYTEANLETHAMGYDLRKGGTLGNEPKFVTAHLYRNSEMFAHNKNYPCVVIFSMANESGNGYNFYATYNMLKDQEFHGRPITYERAQWEWNTDIYHCQYPDAAWFEEMGKKGSDRPIIVQEYSHAMGNSNGGLVKQWQHIYKYPNLQGAYIWDWVDQGFAETDANGVKYWTYGGDYFGKDAQGNPVKMPSDENFNCNGLVNPDRDPHPALETEVKVVYADIAFQLIDGKYFIENRHFFRSLEGYQVAWTLFKNGKAISKGTVKNLNAGPQSVQELEIPKFKVKASETDDIYLTLQAIDAKGHKGVPAGHVVTWAQFCIQEGIAAQEKPGKYITPKTSENAEVATLSADGISLTIDKSTGYATSFVLAGKEQFADGFGFRPNFYRGLLDNDRGAIRRGKRYDLFYWESPITGSKVETCDDAIKIVYTLKAGNDLTLTYSITPAGALQIALHYSAADKPGLSFMPRLGIRYRTTVAQGEKFTYYGRGPQENYSDRCTGTGVGKYSSTATSEYYNYVCPQETGHHIDVKWLQFPGLKVSGNFEFNVLRQSLEDLADIENRHINDIPANNFVEVSLDYRMMGVGGYNSWGKIPDPEHLIQPDQDYDWTINISAK